jgi:hypothetical protein
MLPAFESISIEYREREFIRLRVFHAEEQHRVALRERVCCLLVLNLVSSTPPCIRQPGPRIRVLGVCDFV